MAIITVSNETGCGKDICDILAKRLHYKIINKEIVRYAATIGGINYVNAEMLDETNYKALKAALSEYIDFSLFSPADLLEMDRKEVKKSYNYRPYEYASSPSGNNFQQAIEKVIRMLANEGNVLIMGRGGNFILRDRPEAVHVRIVSPQEERINNVMTSMGLSETEAKKHIQAVDKSKARYIKNYFKAAIADPLNYDIVINRAKLSAEKAAEGIIALF